MSPEYKFFPCHEVAELIPAAGQSICSTAQFAVPREIYAPHPRAQAGGFNKERNWRWLPLMEARTADGEWCGNPVTMLWHTDGPYAGGVWAEFGIADAKWYRTAAARELVRSVAERMQTGAFILDGGASCYTYFENQSMELGMRIANTGRAPSPELVARATVRDADNKAFVAKEWPVRVPAGETVSVSATWNPPEWPANGFTIHAELLQDGCVIDTCSHEAHLWRPKEEEAFRHISGWPVNAGWPPLACARGDVYAFVRHGRRRVLVAVRVLDLPASVRSNRDSARFGAYPGHGLQ